MSLRILVRRTSQSSLDANASSGNLLLGEPYLITDKNKLAVGTGVNTYFTIDTETVNSLGDKGIINIADGEGEWQLTDLLVGGTALLKHKNMTGNAGLLFNTDGTNHSLRLNSHDLLLQSDNPKLFNRLGNEFIPTENEHLITLKTLNDKLEEIQEDVPWIETSLGASGNHVNTVSLSLESNSFYSIKFYLQGYSSFSNTRALFNMVAEFTAYRHTSSTYISSLIVTTFNGNIVENVNSLPSQKILPKGSIIIRPNMGAGNIWQNTIRIENQTSNPDLTSISLRYKKIITKLDESKG